MLTAVRINAVSAGSASQVEGDVWTVDPARQSAGKATPRVPLSPKAVACLDGLRRRPGRHPQARRRKAVQDPRHALHVPPMVRVREGALRSGGDGARPRGRREGRTRLTARRPPRRTGRSHAAVDGLPRGRVRRKTRRAASNAAKTAHFSLPEPSWSSTLRSPLETTLSASGKRSPPSRASRSAGTASGP